MTFLNILKNIFFFLLFAQIAPTLVEGIRKQYAHYITPKTKVAVINIKGVIGNSHDYTKHLDAYFKDPALKAILLIIECPGGAAGSSQSIFNEIMALKKSNPKPVIALVENLCTSGGYYIACAADHIIAPGSAVIGNIGTCLPYCFQLREFIEQFKINYVPLKAGSYKTIGDPFADITPAEKELLQSMLDDTYQQFINDVAHARKLSISSDSNWAEGKIFSGKQALEHRLIDELGSAQTAIKAIKEKALIEGDIEWIKPPSKNTLLSFLSNDSSDNEEGSIFSTLTTSLCSTLEERYLQQHIKM